MKSWNQKQVKGNSLRLSSSKELKTMVENRRAFTLDQCELNVFETYQYAKNIALRFNDLVITNMVRGKKIMYLYGGEGFNYLPGETVIVPANTTMLIDFPEAKQDNPTQCTALAIEKQQIINVVNFLNERYPRVDGQLLWNLQLKENFHFQNNKEIMSLVEKLIQINVGNQPFKDALAEIAIQELLIRIMQYQNLTCIEEAKAGATQLSDVVAYIRNNLSQPIKVEDLCKKACMSKPGFFRAFKNELGISPMEFIIRERIRVAKKYLASPSGSIKEACYAAGFNSINYFSRIFKKHEGITPGAFQGIS
ncbi:helix-turn-helix domain-containing protein [Olivibacter sitiensis]|uniref:helix-turn-helix domain-containing protein n=1 Tax=Olivibacter sitiensis TaxID=376470 RepID=UPI0003F6F3EC|nr:helix-turn-helix domain-containing protein [Olivibacter sitiensis]